VSRLSLRSFFIAAVVLLGGIHAIAVTVVAVPTNRVSNAVAPHVDYLQPYFAQNWRLFAPSPIAEDREIHFQGAYMDDAGKPRTTQWVNWTAVELDLIRHRLVGGRAGYVTNKLYGPLMQRHRALTPVAQDAAESAAEPDEVTWPKVRASLLNAGATTTSVDAWMAYEKATIRLGTAVLQAQWPDVEFSAVRYRLSSHPVTPYAARNGTEAERNAARPAPTLREQGWRPPTLGSVKEREAIAAFARRHR
jgi:hypothetical protein